VSTPGKTPLTSAPPPPPSSGGSGKYIVIGLLLLLGAAGLWVAMRPTEPPPAPPPPPPPAVERVNPMKEPQLELEPEPEPPPPPPPEPVKKAAGGGKKPAEWDCSGDLPGAAKVVNENRPQIRSCYERRLKVNNVLQGNMTLKLKVSSSGKVAATQVTGSLRDQAVFSCVRTLAETWTFPVPSGGSCAVVEAPFQFSPKP